MPSTRLVNDLEHLFRNVRKRGGASKSRMGVLVAYLAFSAYLPSRPLFGAFWTSVLARMRDEWGTPDLADYLVKDHGLFLDPAAFTEKPSDADFWAVGSSEFVGDHSVLAKPVFFTSQKSVPDIEKRFMPEAVEVFGHRARREPEAMHFIQNMDF